MSSTQGKRVYLQILLEEHRGQMFLADAKLKNKKPAALVREIVYDYLKRTWDGPAYQEAADKDRENYQRAVNARLIGRGLPPKPIATTDTPATQETQCDSPLDATEDPGESSAA